MPPEIEGLSRIDVAVLTICCNRSFELRHRLIDDEWLSAETEALGITIEDVVQTQEVLANRGYAEVLWTGGPKHICSLTITEPGFNQYARTRPDYKHALETVGLMIVRDEYWGSDQMMEQSDLAPRLIEHALFVLDSHGLIRTTMMMDGDVVVDYVSPELRREIEAG